MRHRDLADLRKRQLVGVEGDDALHAVRVALGSESGGIALALARERRNVIVLRTLSKSFSLAGMRIGLGFARLGTGGIDGYDAQNRPTGSMSYRETAAAASVRARKPRRSIGVRTRT